MTTGKRKAKQARYRELTDADKTSIWYVDLPDDRPTRRTNRVSVQEWNAIIDNLIVRRTDGTFVMRSCLYDFQVGGPEWYEMLTAIAMKTRRRLFWEPRYSRGLTPENALRYGEGVKPDRIRVPRTSPRPVKLIETPSPTRREPSVFD